MTPIRPTRCLPLAGLVLALPAAASGAPQQSYRYAVGVDAGSLQQGTRVNATAVVTNPQRGVSEWWSRSTVSRVVRTGVNGGYESPYRSLGYSCTPTVTGNTAAFVCTLRGADVPTSVRLTFRATYPTGAANPAKGSTCAGSFDVGHDDRIGAMRLLAGPYAITVRGGLSCTQASARFTSFLQDFDGRLPAPWVKNNRRRSFTQTRTGAGFSVQPITGPVPSGPTRTTGEGRRCPGTFRVQHDDRIGALPLPAGRYRITLGAAKPVSCALASFLDDPNGKLPRGWSLSPQTGVFSRSGAAAFRVKAAA